MDVLDLIKMDHQKVLEAFNELEKTAQTDVHTRNDKFSALKKDTVGHMEAEENVFYPALKNVIPDLVSRSYDEHSKARSALNDLEGMSKNDDRWLARLISARDLIVSHMQLEEGPVFDAARKAFNASELQNLASRFQEAKGFLPVPPATAATSMRGTGAEVVSPPSSVTEAGIHRLLSASTLKGDKVRNPQGEDLGKIEDFMIDRASGCMPYAALSFGGVAGLGDKLFAVPWKAMALDRDRHEFVLNMSKDVLKNAPGFDKSSWPSTSEGRWTDDIRTFYGVTSEKAGTPAATTQRLLSEDKLKGSKVRNAQGDDLGKIEEFMIDLNTGCIAYAVLSFGGFLGMGDKLFAVPWMALTRDDARNEFVLNVDKDRLKNAPGFDKNNWPNMAEPRWGEDIHAYYEQIPYWKR
ncbi:MAG TPA: PRC-barrel domain-containing protein [Methanotrichaceae archaeon]|nr:PRC-barrel domain-containing protein [Methanotrichaceae archaeon]